MKYGTLLRKVSVVGVTAACALALVGCSGTNYGFTGGVAATVNGAEIEEDTITKYVQDFRIASEITTDDGWGEWMNTNGYDPTAVRESVIDYYVDKELVNQACEEKGITIEDSAVQEQLDSMKSNYDTDEAWQEALNTAGITEEEYRDSIKQGLQEQELQNAVVTQSDVSDKELLESFNLYKSMFNDARRSSHILFSSDNEQQAQEVLDKINKGEISFEDAAKQYSTDSASAEKGGDVGWDKLTSFVDAYQNALSEMKKGEVSGLVTSDYGIHIIKCTDTYTPPEKDVASVKKIPSEFVDYMRSVLENQDKTTQYQEWFNTYKEQADIVINDMPENLPYNLDMSYYQKDETDDQSTDGSTEETTDESAEGTTEVTTEESSEGESAEGEPTEGDSGE